MGLSKEQRIKIFIAVDVAFFLLEITIGYTAHSLALVADAFHMLNDVISLFVGLWAVKVATSRDSTPEYTYGWARAELLGGLVNGVFLVALCLTIVLDAIQRFFDPQEVQNPMLVLIVGGVGLAFNILGLFVFHQHSHGHDHGHDEEESAEHHHDHEHVHDEGLSSEHAHPSAPKRMINWISSCFSTRKEQSHEHAHEDSHEDQPLLKDSAHKHEHEHGDKPQQKGVSFPEDTPDGSSSSNFRRSLMSSRRSNRNSRSYNTIDDLPTHPASLRNEFINAAHRHDDDEEEDEEDAVDAEQNADTTNMQNNGKKAATTAKHRRTISSISHSQHKHNKSQGPGAKKGGHSHADMNIRGIFMHVLGDALGNVGVMASALIIWQTNWPGKQYADPAISLIITLIILKSAIPLCLDTSKPLLQAVPEHINVDDIREDVASLPGVRSCHDIHVWALTPSKLIATLDVEISFEPYGDGGWSRWMSLAREIKKCLHAFGIHSSTVQPEFCGHGNTSPTGTGSTVVGDGHSHGLDGTDSEGACLLDCEDGCRTGKQCCGPASKAGSGTATPHNH